MRGITTVVGNGFNSFNARTVFRKLPHPIRVRIRDAARSAGALKTTKKAPEPIGKPVKSSPESPTRGKLSVIIPVYNVEEYLEECVNSVFHQSYADLEIILVNDGSTDDSGILVDALAQRDKRVRAVHKENAGLGAARNTGISVATGDFFTFLDSDDAIPVNAYARMMETLHQTGSDFVVGTIRRWTNNGRRVPAWAEKLHSETRLSIVVEDCPEILQDVFACNKVFRRTFWESEQLAFPEGVLYEDQETTAKAYLQSKSFDVIEDIVYDWRIRADSSSITQQKERLVDVKDRVKAVLKVNRQLQEGPEPVRAAWLARTLGPDLGQYYILIPRVGEEYWNELQYGVKELAAGLDTDSLRLMSPHDRLMVKLIAAGDRENAEKVVLHRAEHGQSYPIQKNESGFRAAPDYLNKISYSPSDDILTVYPEQFNIKSKMVDIRTGSDGTVSITAYAFIQGLDPKFYGDNPLLFLVDKDTGKRIPVSKINPAGFDVDAVDGDPWTSYAGTAFTALLDLSTLDNEQGPAGSEWYLMMALNAGQVTLETPLLAKDPGGTTAVMPLVPAARGIRRVVRFSKEYGLSFVTVTQRRFVTDLKVSGQHVDISVEAAPSETVTRIIVECSKLGLILESEPLGRPARAATFELAIPDLPVDSPPTDAYKYLIKIETSDGKRHHIAWPHGAHELEKTSDAINSVHPRVTGYGYLELSQRRWRVSIYDASYDSVSNTLTVHYQASCISNDGVYNMVPGLVLASDTRRIEPDETTVNHHQRSLKSTFSLSPQLWGRTQDAPDLGTYTIRCALPPSGSSRKEHWIPVTRELELQLPQEFLSPTIRLKLGRTPKAGALAVHVLPPLKEAERGRFRQRRLQERIPEFSKLPVEKSAVFFESFGGKSASDSGLELFHEMTRRGDGRTRYWSVTDHSVYVPDGAVPVIRYSEEWFRRLHTAEYLVNNNNFPFYFRKRPEQIYVQTWHGTPLKRIGNDIPSTHLSLPYVQLMQREAAYWDYLLAQNDFAAQTLPTAFGTAATVCNVGYPRNDSLASGSQVRNRDATRAVLGLADDEIAVLYAPTWRDYLKDESNRYKMSAFLDFESALADLGPKYVFLVRGHSNVSTGAIARDGNYIDVSSYVHINELYAASDLLVTDYSSVMFDYCVTGKPIYFLAPDLERYRDSVRGFYFDFQSTSPGPILDSTASLCRSIRAGESQSYADRYTSFVETYASSDDGYAARRVYDHVWSGDVAGSGYQS